MVVTAAVITAKYDAAVELKCFVLIEESKISGTKPYFN
jgi:hypothetical protein